MTINPNARPTDRRRGPRTSRQSPEHMREIGRRGGQATAARHGRAHFVALGRKGGDATRFTQGEAFYRRIGRKGGNAWAKTCRERASAAATTREEGDTACRV